MSENSSFLARGYVRNFARSLPSEQVSDANEILPRERLEDALKDEADRQDIFANLVLKAVSR